MRIAYICNDPGIPVFGTKGCSIHVQEIINCFLKKGDEVNLFSNRIGKTIPEKFNSVKLHPIAVESDVDGKRREIAYLNSNESLTSLLEDEGPFDLIYERYSLWSFSAIEYAKRNNIPCILEVNSPLIEEQGKHRHLYNQDKAEEIASRIFQQASLLVAVSKQVADYLEKYVAKQKVAVIPNGVDIDRFRHLKKPEKKHTDFVVGFVGTLKPWHGVELLIEAFSKFHEKVPGSRLLIVGDGPERGKLEKIVVSAGIANCTTFTGAVSPAEIPAQLLKMDVAAAPYPNLDNFYFSPLKVFEYMAAGLPVIVSNMGQLNELITHGKNGLVYPADQPNKLCNTLCLLFENPEFCRALGQNAKAYVTSKHSWQTTLDRILSELHRVSLFPYNNTMIRD